jgi:hypothetical protein
MTSDRKTTLFILVVLMLLVLFIADSLNMHLLMPFAIELLLAMGVGFFIKSMLKNNSEGRFPFKGGHAQKQSSELSGVAMSKAKRLNWLFGLWAGAGLSFIFAALAEISGYAGVAAICGITCIFLSVCFLPSRRDMKAHIHAEGQFPKVAI